MKKMLLLLLSGTLLTGCCSRKTFDTSVEVPIDPRTEKLSFVETQEVDSVDQLELYSRAREWFARSFVSAKSVLEMDDKEAGKLIGKGFAKIPEMGKTHEMYFTVSVFVKNGKYKSEFTDIYYERQSYNSSRKIYETKTIYPEETITPDGIANCACMIGKLRVKWRDATIKKITELQASLNAAMNTSNDF
jgi:hypothetical protein